MYLLFSSAFRYLYLCVICNSVALIIMNLLLEKKRCLCMLILYTASRLLIVNTFFELFIKKNYREVYLATECLQITYVLCLVISAVFIYVVFCYTFKGEFIKIAIVALASEVVSVFLVYFSFGLINFIEGRPTFSVSGEFQGLDIWIPVLCYGLLFLFYHYFKSAIWKFRDGKFKYKKTYWAVFVLFISAGTYSRMGELYESVTVTSGIIFVFILIALLIMVCSIRKYEQNLLLERGFMEYQIQLQQIHYQKIEEQIHYIEDSRVAVGKEIEKLTAGEYLEMNSKRISKYRKDLVAEYQSLKHGMYCNDGALDAVLSSQSELMEQRGIEWEYSLQEYCEIGEEELGKKDLIHLILFLSHWTVRANNSGKAGHKWVRLHLATVRNQLIIEFAASWDGIERFDKRMFRKYERKQKGSVLILKEKARVQVVLAFGGGE